LAAGIESHAELGLPAAVEEMHRYVSRQHRVFLAFYCNLKPGLVGIERQLALLLKKSRRVRRRERRPALVAGYLGLIAVA
jgi:hypothetical protein